MNTFQIVGLALAGLFILAVARATLSGRLRRGAGLGWILIWAAAAVAILRPELTKEMAGWMGIDRGADLVFYFAILGGMVGFFLVYVKLRRVDENLTRIARHIALEQATEPEALAAASEPASQHLE